MCCCEKPNVNGEPGYRWQPNDRPIVRPVNPPKLLDGEELLHDEPGRCGGLDSHCHHYRVTKLGSMMFLLVRHGGGDERVRLCDTPSFKASLAAMDSTSRYWLLNVIFHAYRDGASDARLEERARWQLAAKEKDQERCKMTDERLQQVKESGPELLAALETASHLIQQLLLTLKEKGIGTYCFPLEIKKALAKAQGRTYFAERVDGDAHVHLVTKTGQVKPLPVRLDIMNASPDGFEWGYSGGGPMQLALALCVDALGGNETPPKVCQYHQDSPGWDACTDGFERCAVECHRTALRVYYVVCTRYLAGLNGPLKKDDTWSVSAERVQQWIDGVTR